MEKVSIIIPVYGVEKYLDRCLESVVTQTYENLEIILVDDASVDRSGKICDEWVKKDSRIKVIHKDINEGLGLTRNRGLKEITGKYVAYVDSDDWLGPKHIENLYKKISAENADICIGGFTRAFSDGKRKTHRDYLNKTVYHKDEIIDNILLPFVAPDINFAQDMQVETNCWRCLYSVDLIRKHNIEFTSERVAVAEDFFYNLKCIYYASAITVSDSVEYFYFENLDSISKKYREERYDRTVTFYREMVNLIEELNLTDKMGYRIQRNYITKIRAAIKLIVNSNLPFAKKMKLISQFLKDDITVNVLNTYPLETYSKGLMVVAYLMKYKQSFFVYLIMKLRNKVKR